MNRRGIISVIIAAALILTFSACASQAPATQDDADKTLVVTDQAARTVEIHGPVERIVSGYYISSSACIALGLADKMVGIEAKADSRPIYALAAPALLELPSVGTAKEFSLETCAALEPDLVILPLRLGDAAEALAEMGIPAILVNPESYEELTEMISLIGKAAGADYETNRLLEYYADAYAAVREIAATAETRPITYMGGVGSYLSTAPRGMHQSTLIELAGGQNAVGVEGNSWTEISYEQLLAFDPEVMIIPSEAGYGVKDVLSDPQLSALKAVATGRVYKMPSAFEAWDSPVSSCMLGARWLLSVLHEDVYSIQTLREDSAGFYREFYGIEIDESLIG